MDKIVVGIHRSSISVTCFSTIPGRIELSYLQIPTLCILRSHTLYERYFYASLFRLRTAEYCNTRQICEQVSSCTTQKCKVE